MDAFEGIVKSIKAEFHTDVYITGSNSKLLSHDINTIFRGRGIEIKVFPLSFAEFLAFRQIEMTHIIENIVYLELLRRGYIVDIGKNREKEIDFIARELGGRQYYIQVSYTIQNEATKEREISAFHRLDDGYKKILITMDYNPLSNLENGYQMMNLFDFLLNEKALEEA